MYVKIRREEILQVHCTCYRQKVNRGLLEYTDFFLLEATVILIISQVHPSTESGESPSVCLPQKNCHGRVTILARHRLGFLDPNANRGTLAQGLLVNNMPITK